MVKHILSFLFVFLILSSFSFAKDNEAKLQQEYGHDLTKPPFFLRFAFKDQFNKDWKDSTYYERKIFLSEYEEYLAAEKTQEKEEAQEEAEKNKELLSEKKEALRKQEIKLKAELAEEKAERLTDEAQQREIYQIVRQQQDELNQMQRELTQARSQAKN